jgi:hypothetical protein
VGETLAQEGSAEVHPLDTGADTRPQTQAIEGLAIVPDGNLIRGAAGDVLVGEVWKPAFGELFDIGEGRSHGDIRSGRELTGSGWLSCRGLFSAGHWAV